MSGLTSASKLAEIAEIICCLSDSDDDDDVTAIPRKVSLDPPGAGGLKAAPSEDDDDDEIEVMDGESYRNQLQAAAAAASASASSTNAAASKSTTANDDEEEELEIVGTHNEQRLPHNRQNCLDYRFCASNSNASKGNSQSDNSRFCTLCYCYVCDKPASECDNWFNGTKGVCSDDAAAAADGGGKLGSATAKDNSSSTKQHMNHCNASDKGSQSTLWKNMRNAVKKGKDPSTVSASRDESYNPNAPNASLQLYLQNYGVYMPPGGGSLHRSDQHHHVRAANHRASNANANPFAAAMLQAAMNHALSRGPPPLGTTAPSGRYSSGRNGRPYTIRAGGGSGAAAAAMSAAIAAMSGGGATASTSSARSSSRGRSRSRSSAAQSAAAAAALSAAMSAAATSTTTTSSRSARRTRPESSEESTGGNKRPAPHDHQARMRTQQMLEDLYG